MAHDGCRRDDRDVRAKPAPVAVPRRSGTLVSPVVRAVVAPVALLIVLLVGWAITTAPGGIPAYLVPTPMAVARRFVGDLIGSGILWPYIATTAGEALLGSLLGAAVAFPLAVLIHRSRWAAAAVNPFLGATQAIPAIALAPLLVLWVGYGLTSVVALCALIVFFPILIGSVLGLRHVDPEVVDAARIDGAGSWARLRWIEIPLAMPSILAGVRNGVTLSVTGAIVGEMVMGGKGLGMILTGQRDALDTAGMVVTIIVLAGIASIAYGIVHLAERRWAANSLPPIEHS